MVNGKVVDESSEVEQIEERKKWARKKKQQCNVVIYIDLNIYIRTWGCGWFLILYVFRLITYVKSLEALLMCPMWCVCVLYHRDSVWSIKRNSECLSKSLWVARGNTLLLFLIILNLFLIGHPFSLFYLYLVNIIGMIPPPASFSSMHLPLTMIQYTNYFIQ